MRAMRSWAVSCLLASLLALHAREVTAGDHDELPPKLAEAGFVTTLEAAKKQAAKEDKVILLYVTPSWFT